MQMTINGSFVSCRLVVILVVDLNENYCGWDEMERADKFNNVGTIHKRHRLTQWYSHITTPTFSAASASASSCCAEQSSALPLQRQIGVKERMRLT